MPFWVSEVLATRHGTVKLLYVQIVSMKYLAQTSRTIRRSQLGALQTRDAFSFSVLWI